MTSAVPKRIGRYDVERLLGAGGMGAVYLAEDPVLKRRLAVKVVQAGAGQQEILLRFQREAEISARLNHPNVIIIYDVGEDPAVGPFIAMEFIDGSSLAEMIRDGAFHRVADRARVLIPAVKAIEAAHAAGIVHRDIKPGNLMVGRDGRVKLMDFGIARSEDSNLTSTGSMLGTPVYIAPEQLKGEAPSPGTDRYAFSVMTFELFTGTKPYSGPTTSTLLYKIAHEPPAFPERMEPALRKVFERALAKEPAERFADLRTFLAAVIAASVSERHERDRLRGMLEADMTLALRPDEAPPATGAEPTQAIAPPIAEGMSGKGLLLLGGGAVAAIACAGVGFYLYSRPSLLGATAARPVPIEAPRAVASTPAETTSVAAKTQASVSPPEPPAAPLAAVSLNPVEAPPPAADAPRVAAAESEPEKVVSIGPPPQSPPEPPKRRPPQEVRDTIRSALRVHGLAHVDVRLDGGSKIVLANLRDAAEAERARALAVEASEAELEIDTSIRAPVREAARSVKGARSPNDVRKSDGGETKMAPSPRWEIHRDGAEATD